MCFVWLRNLIRVTRGLDKSHSSSMAPKAKGKAQEVKTNEVKKTVAGSSFLSIDKFRKIVEGVRKLPGQGYHTSMNVRACI